MKSNRTNDPSQLMKIHVAGILVCAVIAGSSVYFAGNSITKRRGLFLSARHEFANAKENLNESISKRTSLAAEVHQLEKSTRSKFDLVSVKQLNSRTAAIVELAESTNVRIDSLQPEERILDERVPVQPMLLTGVADADDLSKYLGLLNEQMPDIHVQSVDLTIRSLESSSLDVSMDLFWFIDPADSNE
jgi:hypothetical protein